MLLGGCRVAGFDQADQLAVRPHHAVHRLVVGARRRTHVVLRDERVEQVGEGRERGVAGALDQRLVDADRRGAEGLAVGRFGGAGGPIGGDAQRRDVGGGVRLSEPAREPRFDELPGDVEISRGRAPQLQCDGQALGERVDPGHGDDRPTRASTADLEEALRLEDAQSLAERGAGDAELSGQLVLRWEPLTDGQLAAGDLASQPLGDDLAGLRHPDLLVRRALIRAVHCHDFDAT